MEKMTKRLLMLRQQKRATGALSASTPNDVGKLTPTSDVTRSISSAMPVKPPESRLAGLTNAWIT